MTVLIASILFVVLTFCGLSTALTLNTMSTPCVDPANALKFFEVVGKLKLLKRTGWVNHETNLPESVADHMYRMSMMSFMITDPALNKEKLMKICMVHDLAESIVGDITPNDPITKEEKRQLEETALRDIVTSIGVDSIADEILQLWLDYETGSSAEAQVAKQLDKLEMIVQADEYEKVEGKRLQSFFDSTKESFVHPEVLAWANLLRERRDSRLTKNQEL